MLDNLNEEQVFAVTNTEGYVRVNAGAGTGKTRTLTYRYAYLINELGISPSAIWAVTFTNKAAFEMKERVRALCGESVGNPLITTFHGFCALFLREEITLLGWPKTFIIEDVSDVKEKLRPWYQELGIDGKKLTLTKAWEYIDGLKETREYVGAFLAPDSEELLKRSKEASDDRARLFWRYLFAQRSTFTLDFDDLILLTLHILQNYPQVLERYQKRFEYILVDEYQDIDLDQNQLVELISAYHKNLFVVGDPDQTIYTFRGARVEYFKEFVQNHPDCLKVFLTKNYRSQEKILKAAFSVISHNHDEERRPLEAMVDSLKLEEMVVVLDPHAKKDNLSESVQSEINRKALFSKTQGLNAQVGLQNLEDKSKLLAKRRSFLPIVSHLASVYVEADYVAEHILEIRKIAPKASIAVLYRANFNATAIENSLVKFKIPYTLSGQLRFFDRKEIKDAIAYLRLRINLHDDDALRRVINVPRRGFGKVRLEYLTKLAHKNRLSLFKALQTFRDDPTLYQRTKLKTFVETLENLASKPLSDPSYDFEILMNATGFEEYIKKSGDDERLESLALLKTYLANFKDHQGEAVNLADFVNNLTLLNREDLKDSDNCVQLMTVHTAKGLEFDYVFLISLNEGTFPTRKAINEQNIEEERRLMYVAMTRAKKQLLLSEAGGNEVNPDNPKVKVPRVPSRFLTELKPEDYLEVGEIDPKYQQQEEVFKQENFKFSYAVGDRVLHAHFGEGVVQALDERDGTYQIFFIKLNKLRTLGLNATLTKLN